MWSSRIRIAAVLLLLVSGCAGYRPMLLRQQAVDAQLKPPSDEHLSIEADQLKHPILKPIAFDASDGFTPDELAIVGVLLNPELRASGTAASSRRRSCGKPACFPIRSWQRRSSSHRRHHDRHGRRLRPRHELGSQHADRSSARIDAAAAQSPAVAMDVAWLEWMVAESCKSAPTR